MVINAHPGADLLAPSRDIGMMHFHEVGKSGRADSEMTRHLRHIVFDELHRSARFHRFTVFHLSRRRRSLARLYLKRSYLPAFFRNSITLQYQVAMVAAQVGLQPAYRHSAPCSNLLQRQGRTGIKRNRFLILLRCPFLSCLTAVQRLRINTSISFR